MSIFDHWWNPQWSKASIMFRYCCCERITWRLSDQLSVNVLQGKLCATCSLIPSLLPVFQHLLMSIEMMERCGDMAIYMYLHYVHINYCPTFFVRMSAGCTHVSALLHALVATTFTEFTIRPTSSASNSEEDIPVTSYPCQWKAVKKRKHSTLLHWFCVWKTCIWQGEEKMAAWLQFMP